MIEGIEVIAGIGEKEVMDVIEGIEVIEGIGEMELRGYRQLKVWS